MGGRSRIVLGASGDTGVALARPPSEAEIAIGADLIRKQSLASLAHVVLNLDEFLYMR